MVRQLMVYHHDIIPMSMSGSVDSLCQAVIEGRMKKWPIHKYKWINRHNKGD